MTIDPAHAAEALALVDRSRRQALELETYAAAGDTVIGWGIAWFAGNLAAQFAPHDVAIVWPMAILLATGWSVSRPRPRADRRVVASIGVIVAYLLLTLAIARVDPRAANASISLLVAACYAVAGVWAGRRFLWLGLALATAVLVGWLAIPAWLYLCLAVGGGGTLVFGGLWMRRT